MGFALNPWVSSFSVSSAALASTPGFSRLFANEVTALGERLGAVWVLACFILKEKSRNYSSEAGREGDGKLRSEWHFYFLCEDRQLEVLSCLPGTEPSHPKLGNGPPATHIPRMHYPVLSPHFTNSARWKSIQDLPVVSGQQVAEWDGALPRRQKTLGVDKTEQGAHTACIWLSFSCGTSALLRYF